MSFKRNLRQDVTHWPISGSDGFGGFTFSAPILLKGRWEEQSVLFMTPEGEDALSSAIVYLGDDVDVGDFLRLGDSVTGTPVTDPTTLTDTHRIRQRNRSTDLRALVALRKVFL